MNRVNRMIDGVVCYDEVLMRHRYLPWGTGEKSYTSRYISENGSAVDFRYVGWYYYNSRKQLICQGGDSVSLDKFLTDLTAAQ